MTRVTQSLCHRHEVTYRCVHRLQQAEDIEIRQTTNTNTADLNLYQTNKKKNCGTADYCKSAVCHTEYSYFKNNPTIIQVMNYVTFVCQSQTHPQI